MRAYGRKQDNSTQGWCTQNSSNNSVYFTCLVKCVLNCSCRQSQHKFATKNTVVKVATSYMINHRDYYVLIRLTKWKLKKEFILKALHHTSSRSNSRNRPRWMFGQPQTEGPLEATTHDQVQSTGSHGYLPPEKNRINRLHQ